MKHKGQPTALSRPKKFRNHWVNPSKPAQNGFKEAAVKARLRNNNPSMPHIAELPALPLITDVNFPAGAPVVVGIEFRMKRPQKHFKPKTKRSFFNIVRRAMTGDWEHVLSTPDIDNMVKFVLDSLNGVVCDDDRQVVTIIAQKICDDDQECTGHTVVKAFHFNHCSLCHGDLNEDHHGLHDNYGLIAH